MQSLITIRIFSKKTFFLSLILSISLHLLFLHLTTRYSIWFTPTTVNKEKSTSLEKIHRNQILKEVFTPESWVSQPIILQPSYEINSSKFQSPPIKVPIISHEPRPQSSTGTDVLFKESLLSCSTNLILKTPEQENFNLFEYLPKDLILPVPPLFTHPLPPPKQIIEQNFCDLNWPTDHIVEPPLPIVSYETPLLISSTLNETLFSTPPRFAPIAQFPSLPSLEELETVSCSDSFDIDILFTPREDEEGYIFALTLIPSPDLHLPRIKQNFSFLIDKSNSIQKERLFSMKNAVYKALEEIDSEDTFNIIAFDHKIEKLSPTPLKISAQSTKNAKLFLNKMQLGSFFSNANLFKPLFLTIPSAVKDDELYTTILLTDGELLNKKTAQKSLLYEWTSNNSSRVSLFALGIGNDPHLSSLNVATAFNRGTMVSSPTKGSVKRKLLKLMKTLSNPIAKNLSCHAIIPKGENSVQFYPKTPQMPHLYLNQPYVILGTAKTLDNFILFVQGRLKDKWIHIKKNISFISAKKGGSSLKMEWALQESYKLYEQYIYDGNSLHLSKAQTLLNPYNLQVTFK